MCESFIHPENKLRILLLVFFLSSNLLSQDWKIDPTWLHRYVPNQPDVNAGVASSACHYKAIFGEGDSEHPKLLSVTRFAEAVVDPGGACQSARYDREEEIYFALEGTAELTYGERTFAMRANDFTYLPPGSKHAIANKSDRAIRVLIMGFKVPKAIALEPPAAKPIIVNLDDVKEETVEGHPASVLYKLLLGPRTGKRDAIDSAYVVTSFFWMNFAPGGTNFPHHHETAEEIYLVLDGEGDMAAGSGNDGIEGRYPAKAGDAYYFRPNCTVGFYNQNRPGAKAHILAVRSQVTFPRDDD
jgi:mannose-6-phosphate isomerase-like protein (cupin superfamily)